ncbi:DUF2537 domain-containing protein [Rhodococcoides fascians]|uniref:DUF2537 domain-containing protein n=1 Tax=Nocardiaceae TaxID=85025 RepID=UPI00050CF1F3|nr:MULTISPECIES: DUF2537 domain-containing protein [Rhodococcus]OZD35000.1 DUF2537 domain-containing protein [Rhodococcus sp. 06-1477-1B]RZL75472.1 MAG: DUF2537 domain-containing protein [Rhodococcus sp. (in: high G+C Gram-positive bacteria)]AMY52064.1 hypothetical protein A3L23_00707 [Rhodococcus fascians D188]KQU32635.1 hypothetical protein ASH04_10915 [Rhodococcus sp. Leaf233]MDQ0281864.1 hypothetical protein [Rhodococcus fascians]
MKDPDVRWTGVPVAVISAILVAVALTAFGLELARVHPLLAIGLNLVVVAGAAPTVMRWFGVPVWRWAVYGASAGALLSFVALAALAF